jgi:hypothetical protein
MELESKLGEADQIVLPSKNQLKISFTNEQD